METRGFLRSVGTIAEEMAVEAKRARVVMGMSECIFNEGGEVEESCAQCDAPWVLVRVARSEL